MTSYLQYNAINCDIRCNNLQYMKKKKSIAIDMDGVLADVEKQYITWYEREYGVSVPRESLLGIPEGDALPDGLVWKFIHSPGFFRTAPLIDGAVEAVKQLMERYEVYIVSAAMEFPLSLAEKHEWLKEHFPFISWKNIVFCGDKSIVNTDYMIDDHRKNLDYCQGKPIMFTASHNVLLNHHTRANNWQEVLALIA